jgi:hypothetical protein
VTGRYSAEAGAHRGSRLAPRESSLPIEAAGREDRRGGDRVSGDGPELPIPRHSQPTPWGATRLARPSPRVPSHGVGEGTHCVRPRLNSYLFLSFAVDLPGERRADSEHR